MSVTVRRATVRDADAIGAVHVASWEAAYRDDAPAGWLNAQSAAAQAEVWRGRLSDDGDPLVLIAVADRETVVGFSGIELPSRDTDAAPRTGEIACFYVDPAHWRVGAGRALMDASLDELRARGCTTATLWVLEGNVRARAFYTAAGFTADGARQRPADWPDEIRLRRRLG